METSKAQPAFQKVAREQREERFHKEGTIIWLTGLSGAGKITVSIALENALFSLYYQIWCLLKRIYKHCNLPNKWDYPHRLRPAY